MSEIGWVVLQQLVMVRDDQDSGLPEMLALWGVAWFGLHPANAETVNYIIQRGDLLSTLGVVAGVVCYHYLPALRRLQIFLLPVVLGMLCKPPAVVFVPVFLLYLLFFEEETGLDRIFTASGRKSVVRVVFKVLPAVVLVGAFFMLEKKMSPKYTPAGPTSYAD